MRRYDHPMMSPADLEARVAALEVKTDATREAINALGEKLAGHQQETREQFTSLRDEFNALRDDLAGDRQETRARLRSVDEQLAEIKDLIVDRLGGPVP
jgi:uncharacterized coiled-coil protein SlyX